MTGQLLQPVIPGDLNRIERPAGPRRPCGCEWDPVVFGPGRACADPRHIRQWPVVGRWPLRGTR